MFDLCEKSLFRLSAELRGESGGIYRQFCPTHLHKAFKIWAYFTLSSYLFLKTRHSFCIIFFTYSFRRDSKPRLFS